MELTAPSSGTPRLAEAQQVKAHSIDPIDGLPGRLIRIGHEAGGSGEHGPVQREAVFHRCQCAQLTQRGRGPIQHHRPAGVNGRRRRFIRSGRLGRCDGARRYDEKDRYPEPENALHLHINLPRLKKLRRPLHRIGKIIRASPGAEGNSGFQLRPKSASRPDTLEINPPCSYGLCSTSPE